MPSPWGVLFLVEITGASPSRTAASTTTASPRRSRPQLIKPPPSTATAAPWSRPPSTPGLNWSGKCIDASAAETLIDIAWTRRATWQESWVGIGPHRKCEKGAICSCSSHSGAAAPLPAVPEDGRRAVQAHRRRTAEGYRWSYLSTPHVDGVKQGGREARPASRKTCSVRPRAASRATGANKGSREKERKRP